jgi:hypothetical protein
LWGETFDALNVSDIIRDDKVKNRRKFDFNLTIWFGSPAVSNIESPYVQTPREQDALFQEAITTIADALNAPVLATEEVLAGLPTDAKAMTRTHFIEKGCSGYWGYWEPNDYGDFDLEPVNGERIQAHNDPKTAEYLRQFTLDGVRRVG